MNELLACRELSFGYGHGPDLFTGLSWSLSGGQMVGITGASGRGKSTLLYVLGLMLTPRAGDVSVYGKSTVGLSDSDVSRMRAQRFGFVFQDAALDASRSVLDNVTEVALYAGMGRGKAQARARELMDEVGVDVPAARRPGQVSGGQAQRLALARALVTGPQIILADEPTGNLDDANAAVVIGALRRIADQGGLVVAATHDPRLEDACDQVRAL